MLYLIKSGNYLKIGYAKDIKERMKLYITHNPEFELLDQKEGNLYDEKTLQNMCKKWQYRTEWFYYNEEIIKIFKEFVPKNSDHIYKFLITYENRPDEEIIVDTYDKYQDAVKYVLNKYQNFKSLLRIYSTTFSKTCIYPDKVIKDQLQEINRLTKLSNEQSLLIDQMMITIDKLKK